MQFLKRLVRLVTHCKNKVAFQLKKTKVLSSQRFLIEPSLSKELVEIWDSHKKEVINFHVRLLLDKYTVYEVFQEKAYTFDGIFCKNFALELYQDKQTTRGFDGALIIDCGANIGASNVLFSRLYPSAKVIALEPDARNVQLFMENCKASNVSLMQCAVSSLSETLTYRANANPRAGGVVENSDADSEGTSIDSVSINDLISENSKWNPFIIKIDIEGFEKNLFSKNTEWIDKFPIIIIELHDWLLPSMRPSENFLNEIVKRDRLFYSIGENVISIDSDCFREFSSIV